MAIPQHLDVLKQGVPANAIFYFNLDDFNLLPYFDLYTDFLQFIDSEFRRFSGHMRSFVVSAEAKSA